MEHITESVAAGLPMPSIQELQALTGAGSHATVRSDLAYLESLGYIARGPAANRAVILKVPFVTHSLKGDDMTDPLITESRKEAHETLRERVLRRRREAVAARIRSRDVMIDGFLVCDSCDEMRDAHRMALLSWIEHDPSLRVGEHA